MKTVRRRRSTVAYDVSEGPPQPEKRLERGERQKFTCPFCGSYDANAAYKWSSLYGDDRLFIGCFNEGCPIPRRSYVPALSEVLFGLGHDGETKEEIVAALLDGRHTDRSRAVVGIVTDKYRSK